MKTPPLLRERKKEATRRALLAAANRHLRFTLPADAGRSYWIDTSTNMYQWTRLTTLTNNYALPVTHTIIIPNSGQAFFRAFRPAASCGER